MRNFIGLFLAAVISVPCTAQDADSLHLLFDAYWQRRLESNPLDATSIGVHDFDHRLPDVSPDAQDTRTNADRTALSQLRNIDRAPLDDRDKLNYDLFEFMVEQRLEESRFRLWRMPFSNDSGFHTALSHMVEEMPLRTPAEYDVYINRLRAIPAYLNQQIENMRMGLKDGFTQPSEIIAKVEPTFAAIAVDSVGQSVFFGPFTDFPASFSAAERMRLHDEGTQTVAAEVLPAFRVLHQFFRDEYMPGARATLGASDLAGGDEYYASRIKHFTTLDMTHQEIHRLGLTEAERIRGRMTAIISKLGFEGSLTDFFEFLRTDPQFYAQSADELMMRAAWISKRVDEKMPAYFGLLPRMPYGVRAVPDDIAPNYTTGRYWGAIPGQRGGLFMVNTYRLETRPLYNLPALALHEGVPGHHHQIALSKELVGLPEFRRYTYITAFGEGWGLYTEALGEEMGIYQTPYELFGRLTYEMWRAGRLVVDTGIHAMGWSRQQAVDFFVENSALAEHNINTEVDRYIAWPGQALGYKIGELKILELRRKAEEALGTDFDIRAFHDAVLENGAVPLPILEQTIDTYIASALRDLN